MQEIWAGKKGKGWISREKEDGLKFENNCFKQTKRRGGEGGNRRKGKEEKTAGDCGKGKGNWEIF